MRRGGLEEYQGGNFNKLKSEMEERFAVCSHRNFSHSVFDIKSQNFFIFNNELEISIFVLASNKTIFTRFKMQQKD
jgi:hypothetical protein